jgi:hypothetical protein
MNREEARSLGEAMIARYDLDEADGAEIVDEATIETSWGWVFFYQSRRFLETGDPSWCLVGNAPVIVDAETGAVTITGTAFPVEAYIAEYERERGLT